MSSYSFKPLQIDIDDLLPFQVELRLNCTVAALPDKLRKRLPIKQRTPRRGEQTVCIPSSDHELIDVLVRDHGGQGIGSPVGHAVMIARGLFHQVPAWITVHDVCRGDLSPFKTFLRMFAYAVQSARERKIDGTWPFTKTEATEAARLKAEAEAREREMRLNRARIVLDKLRKLDDEHAVALIADCSAVFWLEQGFAKKESA